MILQSGEQKNKQHLVRANEFELELHESISDITLYQKLPVVLQKASLYLSGKKLYILEKNMYQLELAKPRVIKELAKLNKMFKYIVTCVIHQNNGCGLHTTGKVS